MSLVDRKRGRPEGHSVLDDVREEIIRTTINAVFLTPNRPLSDPDDLEVASPFLKYRQAALHGERLLDAEAERGKWT
jgi:hypothetical protein